MRSLTRPRCLPPSPAAKEIERLQKQAGKLEKEAAALAARLGNAAFMGKAPDKVKEEVRAAAAEAEQQLATIRDKIEQFAALA